jgi:hypothetical protein
MKAKDYTPLIGSMQCSPALHRNSGDSCLSDDARTRINRAYTRSTRKNRVKGGSEYTQIKEAPIDASEKKQLLNKFFRPEKPSSWEKKPNEWLDSNNITDVLDQYEEADATFEFIGPVPIDFAKNTGYGRCIVDELCKLNLKEAYAKGTRKIGIVFNLDEHDKPGSHWMCAYIDVPGADHEGAVYYFDSYGMKPPTRIADFMKKCGDQGCTTLLYNDISMQKKNSECGMYCLYCLICLIRGKSFPEVCENAIDDNTMIAFRDVLFVSDTPPPTIEKTCI